MSRVDDLLAELAPEGVRFKTLGSVGRWYGGGTPSKARSEYWIEGTVPWVSPKDMGPRVVRSSIDTITDEAVKSSSARLVPPTSVAMVVRSSILDHTFPTALVPVPIALNQDMKAVVPGEDVLPSYLAHVLSSRGPEILRTARRTGGSVASIDSAKLFSFRIPVPPLEVQREIVRILDQFTQLEAELEAELEARRAQYEHYRKSLLDGSSGGADFTLGEIFEMRAGVHVKASAISEVRTESHPYSCYGGNGVRGYVSEFNFNQDVAFIGRQGALCGNVHRANGKVYATEHAVVVTPKLTVDMAWAFHKLTQMDLNQFKTKSAQPGLSVGRIKELTVALPSLGEQRRVVSVLDSFETLVNDISLGLPAELAARRKQYEYYRDKLLTFKDVEA